MTLLLSNDSCCCSAVPGFYITQHIGKSQSCFWPLITASLQHIRLFLLGEHTRMWGPRLVVFIAVQHTMLTNFSVITYLNTTLHALSCSHSVKKKKWNPNILIGIKTEMKVLKKKKKKIHFQNLILRSGYSRRVMSPFGVVQFAIHLIMCSFLHWDFFYIYI